MSESSVDSQSHRLQLLVKVAESLQDPNVGDVVFSVQSDEIKYLYAWKHILSAESDYFSTCNPVLHSSLIA
jgi:hypothetical protein